MNWVKCHDLLKLSNALGKYFTGYLEFNPDEGEKINSLIYCEKCQTETQLIIPTKEKKNWFRNGMEENLINAPANISPLFKHFWFHARCCQCGSDLILMRS